ncbi:Exported zinc metalloprotease YfgC precursor [Vibrio cholerae]|nr:Exported zinc metalloprotease YfgC precursor [Vibrio cholerae]
MDWFARSEKKIDATLQPSIQYGKALVYLDLKQFDKAEPLLTQLVKEQPDNHFYLDAISDLYIELKQADKAQSLLEKALKQTPNNSVLTINYANVLLKQDKFTDAIRILQRYTHDNPNDINGWQLLSEANSRLGNSAEDLAARGEIMALQANWNKAIQFYTQASQLVELGSLAQARYDARIDQLMVQRERFLSLQ